MAHNAATQGVPFEFGRLLEEPNGSAYLIALEQVVSQVAESNERARKST